MKKSRETLEMTLYNYLLKNNYLKGESLTNYLIEKGYKKGEAKRIVNANTPPETLSELDLGSLTLAIESVGGIKSDDYYNDQEIDTIKQYKKVSKKTNDNVMIFENAFPIVGEGESVTQFIVPVVLIQQLKEYNDNHLIGYNPLIQRQTIKTLNKKGEFQERINLNKKKVNEIVENIMNNKQKPDMIYLNVLKNGYENVKYNSESRTLTITIGDESEVDIIDGFHRFFSFCKIMELDENIDYKTPVSISILDIDSASELIAQIDKHTHISKSKAKILGSSDIYMEMTKTLNKKGNMNTNEMFNRFAEEYQEIKIRKEKFVTFETFSAAIEYNFIDDNKNLRPSEVDELNEYLLKGFNKIIGTLTKKIGTTDSIKLNTKYLDNNAFIGYIAVLSKLYGNEDWREKIDKTLNKLNLDKSNKELEAIAFDTQKVSKTIIKKISEYFIEVLNTVERG